MTTPTTAPVPSTAAADLLYNSERLDEAVNSSASNYTDRFGVSRLTLAGAMARISAINTRGAWASTTAYAAKDVVSQGGTQYICVIAHTSSGSFATDLPTKWRVYQGVLASELAAGDGTSFIGHDDEETFPEGTLGFIIKDRERSILKFLTAAQKADVLSRSGALDLTTPMTTAAETGESIYYPGGKYKFSRIASDLPSGGMRGDGWDRTLLISTDTSGNDLFKFTGGASGAAVGGVVIRDLQVRGALTGLGVPAKSGGAAFSLDAATDENAYSRFEGVMIVYCPIGIDFVRASLWKVTDCDFLAYNVAGIQVANENVADSGDSSVKGCVFNNPYTTGSGIWQKSSGGLKILGNKFLGGARGYTMALEGSTSVLVIAGNSFENMVQQDIVFSQQTSGTEFVNVCITGNEFSVGGVAIATDSNEFLSQVNISANQINMGGVGSNACIALNHVTDFHIGANIIKGNGGSGSSAINITNCANGKIGPNTYSNLPSPISITSSPTVSVVLDAQYGTSPASSTSGYVSYGNLYLGPTVTVTFPIEFLDAPSPEAITLTSALGNGCLGGIVTATTTTGFTFKPLCAITGIAAQCYWTARGIL